MDGLIKGLVDVALGGGNHRRRDDDDDAPRGDRDERSRSTWAQVVSSGEEHDGNDEQGIPRQQHHVNYHHQQQQQNLPDRQQQQQYRPNPPQQYRPDQQEHCAPPGRNSERIEESGGGGSDGGDWETVGDRKHGRKENKRPQKVPDDNWHAFKQHPSEQHYHEQTHGIDINPSSDELHDLSKACNKLWQLDANRLVPGKDYEIDCGEGKKTYQKGDMAAANLFRWLSDDALRRPTFSRFCSLLDNYNPDQGCKEVVTTEEKNEQVAFLEEISRTAPVRYLHRYLAQKGVVSGSEEEFKKMMMRLWFDLHGRAGTAGCSSAFEHVFVGEIKGRGQCEVSGFHNWIQFYLEEAKGAVDYQGYIFPRRRGECPDSETQLLTVQFEWNGVLKSVSSTLVGVSPEFEVALYTLCFFVGGEDNHVDLGPYQVNIKCYRMGNDRIGSVFPIAE